MSNIEIYQSKINEPKEIKEIKRRVSKERSDHYRNDIDLWFTFLKLHGVVCVYNYKGDLVTTYGLQKFKNLLQNLFIFIK